MPVLVLDLCQRASYAASSLETFYADNEDLVGSLNVSFRDGAGEARDEAACGERGRWAGVSEASEIGR